MVFKCINIRQVTWEVLKTAASGFQRLPWDLANVNAWKTMFDPYNVVKTGCATTCPSVTQSTWLYTQSGVCWYCILPKIFEYSST